MEKNPQYAAVLKKTVFITCATYDPATINALADDLRREGLITQKIRDSAIGCRYGPARILAAVQSKIKANPDRFDVFLKSLRNSDLGRIAKELESEYCKFSPLLPLQ